MTESRPTSEAILIDCGDGDLSDATDDFSVLGNSGAATEAFVATGGWIHDAAAAGKAAWTVDAGHGYLPGDSINISESSISDYNPVTSSLWMCHKIAAVTGAGLLPGDFCDHDDIALGRLRGRRTVAPRSI
jgi:hypothetical protein